MRSKHIKNQIFAENKGRDYNRNLCNANLTQRKHTDRTAMSATPLNRGMVMLAWKYVDKQAVVISVIRDFDSMKTIIETTPDEVKDKYDIITNPVQAMIEMSTSNSYMHKSKIEKTIEDVDFVKQRYANAIEYMEWFLPAWTNLKDQDQVIIREYYMSGNLRSGASIRLQHELNYSERQIDRMREKALKTLTVLLFGE